MAVSKINSRKLIRGQLSVPQIMHKRIIPNYEYASIGSRFRAVLIDAFIYGLITKVAILTLSLVTLPLNAEVVPLLQTVLTSGIFCQYYIIPMAVNGQTYGKKKVGIKVLNIETGNNISCSVAAIRQVIYKPLSAISLIGYFLPFFNKQNLALHDKMAKTIVVKVKKK